MVSLFFCHHLIYIHGIQVGVVHVSESEFLWFRRHCPFVSCFNFLAVMPLVVNPGCFSVPFGNCGRNFLWCIDFVEDHWFYSFHEIFNKQDIFSYSRSLGKNLELGDIFISGSSLFEALECCSYTSSCISGCKCYLEGFDEIGDGSEFPSLNFLIRKDSFQTFAGPSVRRESVNTIFLSLVL